MIDYNKGRNQAFWRQRHGALWKSEYLSWVLLQHLLPCGRRLVSTFDLSLSFISVKHKWWTLYHRVKCDTESNMVYILKTLQSELYNYKILLHARSLKSYLSSQRWHYKVNVIISLQIGKIKFTKTINNLPKVTCGRGGMWTQVCLIITYCLFTPSY